MRVVPFIFGGLVAAAGACGHSSLDPNEDPRAEGFSPEVTVCQVDPDDYIYAANPDGSECPDFWVCEDLGEGKRCYSPGADQPDGGEWSCADIGGDTVCVGEDFPEGGEDGVWDCELVDEFVECTRDNPDYPEGGGSDAWDCFFVDEFRVCDSTDGSGGGPGGDGSGGGPGGDGSGGGPGGDGSGGGPGGTGGGGGGLPGDGTICFYPEDDPNGTPVVTGYFEFDVVGGVDAVHVALVFDEGFVDNSYGANSSDGYRGGGQGHRFRDLVSSDHAEVGFLDGNGTERLHAKFDYITESGTEASGYDALGVTGGDGSMMSGDIGAVLDATSSLDRNFNELGCVYTVDSPTAAECPDWDNRVVYEMWLDLSAFGAAGFGQPMLTFVHASPSRTDDTIPVVPGPCP